MKKTIIIFSVALLSVVSCGFLDEHLTSTTDPDEYYESPEQVRTGINGAYANLRNILNNVNYFNITETQTDIIYFNNTDRPDCILNVNPVNPQFGRTMWQQAYMGVMRTNKVLAGIDRSKNLTDEQKAPLIAETIVVRAFLYYILTANFGDVPYYECEVTDDTNNEVARLPRMSASETRGKLISQLRHWILEEKALDFAPTYSASNSTQYRTGAAVGLMLAGKMCLWEERWSEAVEFFGELEKIYGPLSQYPVSDIPFYNKYTPESIFETSNNREDYGLTVVGALASYVSPQRSASVSESEFDEETSSVIADMTTDFYNGIGIPWLGNQARTRYGARPTKRFYNTLMKATHADLRRAAYDPVTGAVINGGGGYMAWGWPGYTKEDDRTTTEPHWLYFTEVGSKDGRPYLGNKFWCPGMQYDQDSNNYKIFRYAGAVLGLAEAYIRLEDQVKALSYLNRVKNRAGLSTFVSSDTGVILQEIMDEYARELFGEFSRKHDLVRWGIWYDSCVKYSDSGLLKSNIKPCHEYYPIPDEEITYSGGALDNNEYKKCGL